MHTKKTFFLSGGLLTTAVMGANVINFVFNAFLGRVLSFEEFGLITFINTLFYIGIIFYNALSTTVNHHVAFLEGKGSTTNSEQFVTFVTKKIGSINICIVVLWILFAPFIAGFFHITNLVIVYFFASIILLYPLLFLYKGYLQGKFFFIYTAILIIVEPLTKLLSAIALVILHKQVFVYASLYIAPLLTVCIATTITYTVQKRIKQNGINKETSSPFPSQFFFGALLTGLSTLSFLALDLILVKHFLNPTIAGKYSLLALIGKIIYFLGSLLSIFIISVVSRDMGKKKNPLISFYKILLGSLILGGISYIALGMFGNIFAPLLFGKKALAIVPYLNLYSLTILLFTLGNAIVTYHLAKKQFLFPIISFIMSFFMMLGIYLYHQNIQQIVQMIFVISCINILILLLFHIQQADPMQYVSPKEIAEIEEMYE